MNVILNTTILSNFARVGRLDLLRLVFGEVHISTDVYAEAQDGLAEGYDFYSPLEDLIHAPASKQWIHLTALTDQELRLFTDILGALHRGEASSIAIAATRGWAFLTDDALARRTARKLKITLSGTLGILVRAVQDRHLTLEEANALLAQMIDAGYYSLYDNLGELV